MSLQHHIVQHPDIDRCCSSERLRRRTRITEPAGEGKRINPDHVADYFMFVLLQELDSFNLNEEQQVVLK
jgi:hypothetical protein